MKNIKFNLTTLALSLFAVNALAGVNVDELMAGKAIEVNFAAKECTDIVITAHHAPLGNKMKYVLSASGDNVAYVNLLVEVCEGFSASFQQQGVNALYNNPLTFIYNGKNAETDKLFLKLCNTATIPNSITIRVNSTQVQ